MKTKLIYTENGERQVVFLYHLTWTYKHFELMKRINEKGMAVVEDTSGVRFVARMSELEWALQ